MHKPKKVWIPKKQQSAESNADVKAENEHIQKDDKAKTTDERQYNPTVEDWNVVQGKKNSDRHTSPSKKVSSLKPKQDLFVNEDTNRFHSLSNLDGDSNVSVDELFATTALVVSSTDAGPIHTKSGEQHKHPSSSHHHDKNVLVRLPSTGLRQNSDPPGVIIKEKATFKTRFHMTIIIWNVRGLNRPSMQSDIRNKIRSLNLVMVVLLEVLL
ncbi:hypothetical protein AAC387_Pa12g0639 [Persea americana]